jgi:dUTPase
LDFYVPTDLSVEEFMSKQHGTIEVNDENGILKSFELKPHQRVLIPSGIKVLITPINSMLQANNKSGVSTKKGLIFTAEVVDSPYTGEVHIGVVNTSNDYVEIKAGEKLVQFVHVPIFLSEPKEITNEHYDQIAKDWGTRGSEGFGSTDNQ